MSHEGQPTREAVAILNERSHNARAVLKQLRAVENELMPVHVVETDFEDYRRTEDQAIKLAGEEGRVLLSAGGDGTLHYLVRMLLLEQKAEAVRETPLGILSGGWANDGARAACGNAEAGRILLAGRQTPFRPLATTEVFPDRSVRKDIGVCYVGYGDTAAGNAAAEGGRTAPEASQMVKMIGSGIKAVRALRGVAAYPGIEIRFDTEPTRGVGGVLAVRGSSLARWARMHASFRQAEWEEIQSSSKGIIGSYLDMDRARRGRLHGTMHADSTRTFTVYGLEGNHTVPVHHDGENSSVAFGTKVTIGLSERPINLITL